MHGIADSWLARGQQRPADAHPDAGQYDPAWTEQREPQVPELAAAEPTDPEHAEREALAIRQAAYRCAEVPYAPPGGTATAAEVLRELHPGRIAGGSHDGGPAPHSADPLEARRPDAFPEPHDYGRPLTPVGRMLTRIDEDIAGSLARRNQLLRRDFADAVAQLGREQLLRKTAETQRDGAQARIAELELTVGALGGKLASAEKALRLLTIVMRHAAGHGEGGESDG